MLMYSTKRIVDDLCSLIAGPLIGNSGRQKFRLLVIGITWRHLPYVSDVNYDGCPELPHNMVALASLHSGSRHKYDCLRRTRKEIVTVKTTWLRLHPTLPVNQSLKLTMVQRKGTQTLPLSGRSVREFRGML